VDARELAALELAAKADIKWLGKHWSVPSMSSGSQYRVDAGSKSCTCENFELTAQPCKHILAVDIVRKREAGITTQEASAETEELPKKKRPTYKQDWAKYNAAQTNEKRVFQHLLADLCGTVPEPERKGPGRPRVPLRDALFAALFKVYSTISGRRFQTDLRTARDLGHTGAAPSHNFIATVLEDEAMTPILKGFVTTASLPLTGVETTFATDSSGFSTNRFGRWFDAKYGVERVRADWVKVHLMSGVNTHIVTAVELGIDHDGQMFPPLVKTTAEHFTVKEVCADKAYLSRVNLELVKGIGGAPFIPFKKDSVAHKQGPVWEKLFHHFSLHRDEFVARYHQRSNVESVFSMVKRKFGDSLRSKTLTALHNEALAKIVCHNLVVLVHEMYELGIAPEFGGVKDEPVEDTPRIIRFPGA
jgi:transposase